MDIVLTLIMYLVAHINNFKFSKGWDIILPGIKEENYEKATFKLIQAISRNHMEAKYFLLLGHCYYNLKNQDFACADWTIANSLDNEILKKEIKDLCNLN